MSSVRSGSTLLRVLLDTHSRIYAPHELHLRSVDASLTDWFSKTAMDEFGIDEQELQFLLWDRILHLGLQRSGKSIFVNKTPNDVFIWRRIVACWPDARLIFLHRHPASIVDSWNAARRSWTREETAQDVLRYAAALDEARELFGGLTVRYEDITADPQTETRRICEYLDLEWEPAMVHYGEADHGLIRRGLGDWSDTLLAGRVQAARPVPSNQQIPACLLPTASAWGYLGEADLLPQQEP